VDGVWAAAGPHMPHDQARRLTYTDVESNFELVTPQKIRRALVRVLFPAWVVFAVPFLSCFFVATTSQGNQDPFQSYSSQQASPGETLATGLLCGLVLAVVVALVMALIPYREPVSEWKTLLEDKAGAAASSYAAVFAALRRHRVPVSVGAQRVHSDLLRNVSNHLVLVEGRYTAYATVFPYGTSLYLGWTMWRSVTAIQVIFRTWTRAFVDYQLRETLTSQRGRAMREAVHSAVREGVEAAVVNLDLPIMAVFGQELPIEDLTQSGRPHGVAASTTPPTPQGPSSAPWLGPWEQQPPSASPPPPVTPPPAPPDAGPQPGGS
jgi:hypothetical protein